jgi:hypothetical protein
MFIENKKRSKNKKRSFAAIKDVLGSKYMGLKLSSLVDEDKIRQAWEEILGGNLAKKTEPYRLNKKILYINVASSVLSNQLHFLKEDMLKKINFIIGRGRVEDLKFSVRPLIKRERAKSDNYETSKQNSGPITISEKSSDVLEKSGLDPETKRILRNILVKSKTLKK